MNKDKYVVSLCDKSGVAVKPWADAGYTCYCVDIQHSIRAEITETNQMEFSFDAGNIHYVWGDVRTWSPPEHVAGNIAMLMAFPPCTHVAVSGARDFRTKGTALLRDSLEMFSACEHAARWSGAPYFIENPVGKFSDHMGKPTHTFQPWQYGDNWTKLTCLWTGNGFVMPEPYVAERPDNVQDLIWKMPPSKDRADMRSLTPQGFANAVFTANGQQD